MSHGELELLNDKLDLIDQHGEQDREASTRIKGASRTISLPVPDSYFWLEP